MSVDCPQCKCCNCNQPYHPHPRSRHHQKYCPLPGCRKASKAASQQRWRESDKGRNYFRGPINCQRVKEWRKAHPGYWRPKPSPALPDDHPSKTPVPPADKPSCNAPDASALQDLIRVQGLVLTGLVVQFTGALQDQIAPAMQRLVRLGQQFQEFQGPVAGLPYAGFQASALQGAAATGPPAVQLDRPSPGP